LRIARSIAALLQPHATVAVLGAAYKPDAEIIEESHAILIDKQFRYLAIGAGFARP
jgi:hypothetical protein